MMSTDTLEQVVRRALEEANHVSFGFQGGEPMLSGLPFYKELIRLQQQYNTRGVQVSNTIQTNGSLIDEEWANFFAGHGFLVGLSIDGAKETHDTMRRDADGEATHARCVKAAGILRRAGADFNVLSVLTKQFARHPDQAWRFYKQNDFRFVQLIPCLDGLDEAPGVHPWSLDAETYGRFLCRFFDLWYEDFIRGEYISVRAFDNWVRMLMGQQPENCGMAGQCRAYPVVEADGSVYPCDFYVLDEHKLGDVSTHSFGEMLTGEEAQRFMHPSRVLREECGACDYAFICRAGCRRDREPIEEGLPALNRYCAGYKTFFAHALPRMVDIARRMPR